MGAVDAYCCTPRGVIDERWIWVFMEVAYFGTRVIYTVASVQDSVWLRVIIMHSKPA